ncbi:MAG: biotin/lipoyl-binding protein [Verrucomicrobia bacterium]|nr:biotin/lipoyl-binding protein [Verrucomicrobiota bacterium]
MPPSFTRPRRGIIRRAFEPDVDAPMPSTIFWSRIFLYILVLLSAAFGIWISVASIGQVVPAQGKLVPAGNAHEVQAPVQGVISEVLIRNGNSVRKGQTLMRMNQDVAQAEMQGLEKQRAAILQDLSALEQKKAQKSGLEKQIPGADNLVQWSPPRTSSSTSFPARISWRKYFSPIRTSDSSTRDYRPS